MCGSGATMVRVSSRYLLVRLVDEGVGWRGRKGVGCKVWDCGATILCVSSRYLRCDSSAAASMAWLVRGRQRRVGRLASG